MRLAISAVQSPNQPGDEHPKIIRPKKDGQKPLPKSQMQEPNGKQPPRKPGKSRQPAIFNFNLFHKDIIPQTPPILSFPALPARRDGQGGERESRIEIKKSKNSKNQTD